MAVVNIKSTPVTNDDAKPQVPNDKRVYGPDYVRAETAVCAAGATDSNASTYRFFRVRSSMRLISLKLYSDANTGATSYDTGIYDTAANGAAAVSDAIFDSARDIHLAQAGTELVGAVTTPANMNKRLWELLGLSSDPVKQYDLVITADTAGTGGGNMTLVMLAVD